MQLLPGAITKRKENTRIYPNYQEKKSAPNGKLEYPFRKKKQRIKETPEIEKIKEIPAFKEHERDTNLKEFGVLEASIWQ